MIKEKNNDGEFLTFFSALVSSGGPQNSTFCGIKKCFLIVREKNIELMAHWTSEWPSGGDNVVRLCMAIPWLNRHRNTYHASEMDPTKNWERKNEIIQNAAALHVSVDDREKNVYPPATRRKKWQQIRLFRRRFLSPPVGRFYSVGLRLSRWWTRDRLPVNWMQHFLSWFVWRA